MVVLIRCNDILSDPRAMKYVRYLQEKVLNISSSVGIATERI